jgi:hypothetical protein
MCGDSSFVSHFLSEIYDFFLEPGFERVLYFVLISSVPPIFVDPAYKEDTVSAVSIALLAE